MTLIFVIFGQVTWAHGIRLTAAPTSDGIAGHSYLSDGGPVAQERVSLYSSDGSRLESTKTDSEGAFYFALSQAGEYTVVVQEGEGHRAEARVDYKALDSIAADPLSGLDREALTSVLREELQPLREDLAHYEQRIRIQDAVAGFCVIIGFAGALTLWRSRRYKSQS